MRTEGWQRNLVALWIASTLTMMAFSFVFPFVPLYVQTLGVSDATAAIQWAGIIAAATALSMSVTQPIWGNLADRWGRRPMVIRSMIGGAILITLMGLVASPEQLLVLRLIQGGVTGTITASNALVSATTPKHRIGFALGLLQVAVFVGGSIGPLAGGLIADTIGFRAAFLGAGAALMVGGLIVIGFVREDHVPPPVSASRQGAWGASRSLLSIAFFPTLIGVNFLIFLGNVIVNPVLSLFVVELSGGDNAATMAGVILAGTGLVSAVSALVLGRLSDRIGHPVILVSCLLGASVTYFPQTVVQAVWQLLVLRTLLGVFLGGLMPSVNAMIATTVPRERRGAAFGLGATASSLAFGLGPLAGAGVATQWGMRSAFLATGILYALAFGWVGLQFRNRRLARLQREADSGDTAAPA